MSPDKAKKEVEKIAYEFEDQIKNGYAFNDRITFSEYKNKWLEEYAIPNLKLSTADSYNNSLKRIDAFFGHMKLMQIRPLHIIEYINMISKDGMRNDYVYIPSKDLRPIILANFNGITKFADIAGISSRTVTSAVKGNNITKQSAVKISAALEINLSEGIA